MKRIALCIMLMFGASGAAAQCFADYKAKQDNPLRLHYGVVQLSGACTASNARAQLNTRLARNGWTLLQVMSVFGPEGLNQRKNSAGAFFLRY